MLTCRQMPLAHALGSTQLRPAAVPEELLVGRQWSPAEEAVPVQTEETVQRRPLPHEESLQHVSAHVPLSQRPLRHDSAVWQLSPIAFVPTLAMPRIDAFTQ